MYRKTNIENRKERIVFSVEQNLDDANGGRRFYKNIFHAATDTQIETSLSRCQKGSYGEKSQVSATFRKTLDGKHKYCMVAFFDWFIRRDTLALLRLLEAADPQQYNVVFQKELDELLNRISDEGARQEILDLKSSFDFSNYILNSLKRANFRDDDSQQDAFQEIAVRLLVSPGKLFHWNPEEHGPLALRFKSSVWNAIRNIVEKRRNRRKWMQNADPVAIAERTPQRASQSHEIIDVFRQLVRERLGNLAAQILDQRLQGLETKKMVGQSEFGMPSAFYLKKEVQAIKDLADRFAARIGDNSFANMDSKAMERENSTVEKRKAAMAAKSA